MECKQVRKRNQTTLAFSQRVAFITSRNPQHLSFFFLAINIRQSQGLRLVLTFFSPFEFMSVTINI